MTASEKIISTMGLTAAQAVVLHNESNMFWATEGYTGEGAVLITAARRVILTDFRYTEQAQRQAPAFECIMTTRENPVSKCIAAICSADGISEVFCETDYLTVDQFGKLQGDLPGVKLTKLDGVPQKLRAIKTEAEAANIREACRITSATYDALLGKIREGMTEIELRIELDFLHLKLGASDKSFNTIIASGENGSLPHAIPGPRKLRKGDMITMDFGCIFNGYMSDCTRTVALGEPSAEMRRIYDTVLQAHLLGEELLAPGKLCSEIDGAVRKFIDDAGYAGRFGHSLGHSVGIDIHEQPGLSMSSKETVQVGHVLTVEPGIYVPGLGGVRIEDTCLVIPGGCEPLTTAPKTLTIL